ncbi:MAG: efflux RND transporter periplasmic adaptor subunit [Candidatus Scalindua sp.]
MKRKIVGLYIVIAVNAVITLAVLYGGRVFNHRSSGTEPLPKPDIIGTATPQRRDFTETCRWFGTVESRDKVKIVALETGRVVSIAARDEMPVTKGELLFTIGGPLVDSRREVLRNKSATLHERIILAEQTVKIVRDAVSQKVAKYEELASVEDDLVRLRAKRESAGQEIQRLQEAIHVRATMVGILTNRKVYAGQEVRKGDDLAEIISLKHIYIVATLFSRGGDAELEEKRVVINLPGGNSSPGTITSVLPQRTAGGAVVVWIERSDLAPLLRPGQTVSGTVVLAIHKGALAIPQNAIVRDEKERAYVFLNDSSGYCRKRVETGIVSGDWVEIISGLKEQDEVVVRGAYELFYMDFNKMYKVVD